MEWVFSLLITIVEFLLGIVFRLLAGVRNLVVSIFSDPVLLAVAVYAIARLFATVVETGSRAVIFRFGRVCKEVDHGFHWLIPGIDIAKHIRVRTVTMDLPPQRATTTDGLVYRFEINIVYRIESARDALVEINDVSEGIRNISQQCGLRVISRFNRRELLGRDMLNQELRDDIAPVLARYGVYLEHAGFQTIAPTRETLRLTQLSSVVEERRKVFELYRSGGMTEEDALHLVGANRVPQGHLHLRVLQKTSTLRKRRRREALIRKGARLEADILRKARMKGYLGPGPAGGGGVVARRGR